MTGYGVANALISMVQFRYKSECVPVNYKIPCALLNKTYIYIADCTQIYLGEIIILFDDICCSDYWPLSTTFTCSSTSPLLGGGARINNT